MLDRNPAAPLTCTLISALLLAACSKVEAQESVRPRGPALAVELPSDPEQRAMTCYAAEVVGWDDQGHARELTDEQANRAAQFILLGASRGGVTEVSKITELPAKAGEMKTRLRREGKAERYARACASSYPMTQKAAFRGLAADSRDAKMQCFALATAMTQIYANSPTVRGPRIESARRLSDVLNEQLSRDLDASGDITEAEIAVLTMRGLAVAVQGGPITETIDACAARFAPDRT